MSTKADAEKVHKWLVTESSKLPKEINLVYVEWNEGWINQSDYRDKKPKQMCFSLFGYHWEDSDQFDPEIPEHLEFLTNPQTQSQKGCGISLSSLEDVDEYAFFENVLKTSPSLRDLLQQEVLAWGRHESEVKVFQAKGGKKARSKKTKEQFYYELHVKSGPNDVETYEIGGFDETPLLNHNPVPKWPKNEIKLILENARRLYDCVLFYRGWLICSERFTKLLEGATSHIQTYPAPLFKKGKEDLEPVEGYFIVNLYEKLDCLHDEDVLPPAYKGGPLTFNPGKGYRVKVSAVESKHLFRINYEYFRLLVSQEFRDELEKEKITGITWLRRKSVE